MVQLNQAVYVTIDEEVRWYKGPPTAGDHRALELYRPGQGFFGGYCYMSQGPLPVVWSGAVTGVRKLWGESLQREMEKYNHQVGLKMVGETLADERNRVSLADEKDRFGLPIARVTCPRRQR
jgi:hypothetical protein